MGIKNSQFSLQDAVPSSNATKFNLYLKNHEIKQINSVLQSVLMMSRDQREEWIIENGEIVQSAFDTFIDDSNVVIDGISLDDEALELSQELVVSLRNTMETVESILSEGSLLEG